MTPPADNGKMLFILAGQSNMQGLDESLTFVPRIEEAYGKDNILVVKEAIGGRPIRMWVHDWAPAADWKLDPDNPGVQPPTKEENGIMYKSMMGKIADATRGIPPKAIAFCWMQGERDAREGHAAVYAQSLHTLFAQLNADFKGIPLVFVIGKLNGFGKDNKQKNYPDWEEIRHAQEQVARVTPHCRIITTDDLNTGPSKPHPTTKEVQQFINDLHMSAEGYRILGSRFADSAIELLNQVVPKDRPNQSHH